MQAAADSTTASRTSARRSWGNGTVEQAVLVQRSIDSQTASRPVANKSLSLPGNERGLNNDQAFDRVTVTSQETGRGLPFDFSTISVDPPGRANRSQVQSPISAPWVRGAIQAKLVIGEAHDPLEQEADRIADQVMRKPNPDCNSGA